jgi:hypothetical protein
MDVQTPVKKKKLVSMKKVQRIDTDLKRNAPVDEVKKDADVFVKYMVSAKKGEMEEIARKEAKQKMKNKPEVYRTKLFAKPTMNVGSGTMEPTYEVVKPKKVSPILKKSMMKRKM